MKANELMIGNWMMGNKPFQIRGNDIGLAYKHEKFTGKPRWEPIPLTEEWLIRFGFEKIDHISGYSFFSLKRKRNTTKPSICIYSKHTTISNSSQVKHCQHIHQLQILYFALTGEQLNIQE